MPPRILSSPTPHRQSCSVPSGSPSTQIGNGRFAYFALSLPGRQLPLRPAVRSEVAPHPRIPELGSTMVRLIIDQSVLCLRRLLPKCNRTPPVGSKPSIQYSGGQL